MALEVTKSVFEKIAPFEFSLGYGTLDADSPENAFTSHVHDACEIYINLSGDVAFMVEGCLYPILPGNIIITRPFEYHHCIYRSNAPHEHFWILFSCEGNEKLFDLFFNRKAGEGNLLTLPIAETDELIALCHSMRQGRMSHAEQYLCFFKLLALLERVKPAAPAARQYPDDLRLALHYINTRFAENLTIAMLAQQANVSQNTLERHFARYLRTTPAAYLRGKRLAGAAQLLAQGANVTEACQACGFADCSSFIALFRKTYGQTPLQYKKSGQV